MADAGGTLAFDDVVLGLELPADLPAFVPQVDGGDLATLDAGLEWPAYALGLRRVISPKTLRVYPRFAGRLAAEGMARPPVSLVYVPMRIRVGAPAATSPSDTGAQQADRSVD